MKPEEIKQITELKEYAIKRGKYTMATMLRDMEKEAIKELNSEYTDILLEGITNQIKEEYEI